MNQSLKACEGKIITEQNSLRSLERKIKTINDELQREGIPQSEREFLEAQLAATQESRDASKNQLDAYMEEYNKLTKEKKSWENNLETVNANLASLKEMQADADEKLLSAETAAKQAQAAFEEAQTSMMGLRHRNLIRKRK